MGARQPAMEQRKRGREHPRRHKWMRQDDAVEPDLRLLQRLENKEGHCRRSFMYGH